MFVGLVLLVLIVMLLRMRGEVTLLRQRIDRLEGVAPRAGPSAATVRVGRAPSAPWESPRAEDAIEAAPPPAPTSIDPPAIPADPIEPSSPPLPDPLFADPVVANDADDGVAAPPRRPNFEDLFGRRLPIWAGGITLAVAGMLIVRYSIEAGLLSPLVRVICGLLFGTGLIVGAEAARRAVDMVRDPRIAQALAGAGVACLYASILVAANLYHLIGGATAFVGLAAVTALAMGLALRFGAPSALLGLVGGLAAPALVGSTEPNVPLLTTYLALAVGGLCTLSRNQRWAWLGISALAGGFGWGGLLLIGGMLDTAASISIAAYLILLGIGLPLLIASGKFGTIIRTLGALLAAAQIAALVATGGFSLLHWGLFGLISVAMIWVAQRETALAKIPAIGLAIGLLLLGAWPDPSAGQFALVALVMAAIYGAPAILALWRSGGGLIEAAQIAAIALVGAGITIIRFNWLGSATNEATAWISLCAALLPTAAAALGWRAADRHGDARFALLVTASALLVSTAAYYALPLWSLAAVVAAIGFALLQLSLRADDRRVEISAWAFAAIAVLLLTAGEGAILQIFRIFGETYAITAAQALPRWGSVAIIAGLFAWRARSPVGRMIAQGAAAVLGYGALAQIVPALPLPLVPAIGMIGTALWSRRHADNRLLPALGTLLAITLCWALLPLGMWLGGTMMSLAGDPLLVTTLPEVRATLLRLLVPALAVGGAYYLTRGHLRRDAGWVSLGFVALAGGVAAHILFKHIFSLDTPAAFIQLGMAERTVWQGLLIGIGIGLAMRVNRLGGLAIAALGLLHFSWYTLFLHNPLWTDQAVGTFPMLNWLTPAYAIPLIALWRALRPESGVPAALGRPIAIAQMALILLLSFSLLRQMFVGSLLTVPGVSDAEDIARSITAILLGIGFLLWGIVSTKRDWRIGSLLLMIAAVGKVFLLDASGLDGLARIGSFVALGFSLIGIGWLYSRYLADDSTLTGRRPAPIGAA